MKEPIFLKPTLQNKMWGGQNLRKYGYELPSEHVGEAWAISGHENGPSLVINGKYAGCSLADLWKNHRELFGNAKDEKFPLLTKILDANQDLSVQVHPNDEYALKKEGELGKTECWYILDAKKDAQIIYGHHAKTSSELKKMIKDGNWNNFLRKISVKKGDFIYVPSGTIHAIGSGVIVLETQQSSDTTYRVYDFDRIDESTKKKRELHIQQALDVTTVPHLDYKISPSILRDDEIKIKQFIANEFFTVELWEVIGSGVMIKKAPYTLISVIDGSGEITVSNKKYPLSKGMHFILPSEVNSWKLSGNLKLIASYK